MTLQAPRVVIAGLLVLLVFGLSSSLVSAQIEYVTIPEVLWTSAIVATVEGNGLYYSPENDEVVGTVQDGSLYWFGSAASDNPSIRAYTPAPIVSGATISAAGGVTFAYHNESLTPYLTYAVTETSNGTSQTRVLCVTPDGELLAESVPLAGSPAGKPETSSDGRYIYVTHNVDQSTGYFTILDYDAGATDTSTDAIPVYYQYTNSTNPFSPIGVYHNPPNGGYYDGGENNTNDFFIWAFDTAAGANETGLGAMFVFQMPMTEGTEVSVTNLGDVDFQASTAPILTNDGMSMYWAVTRSDQSCWVGAEGLKAKYFNRGKTNKASFPRGEPVFISARASPSLSYNVADPSQQLVWGPAASTQVFRLNFNYSEVAVTNTSWLVSSRVAVSPDNAYIYYATQDGVVAQLDATTLSIIWTYSTPAPVVADICLNDLGTVLFVADTSGLVTGLKVAINTAPTMAPVMSMAPAMSMAPSSASSDVTSDAPSSGVSMNPASTEAPNGIAESSAVASGWMAMTTTTLVAAAAIAGATLLPQF